MAVLASWALFSVTARADFVSSSAGFGSQASSAASGASSDDAWASNPDKTSQSLVHLNKLLLPCTTRSPSTQGGASGAGPTAGPGSGGSDSQAGLLLLTPLPTMEPAGRLSAAHV